MSFRPLNVSTQPRALNVLIACERSGVVRRAFRALGHNAWSCDLVEADDKPDDAWLDANPIYEHPHFKEDALLVASRGVMTLESLAKDGREPWDLIVAHPVCQYLCNSGVRWLAPGGVIEPHRYEQMIEGAKFFAALYHADCPAVAVENPVMHKHAREYLSSVPRFTQSIQPWQFGTDEQGPDNVKKRTCLWLRGLPSLVPTGTLDGSTARPDVHFASPGPDRARQRSQTFPGFARAMAVQWSEYLLSNHPQP